MAVASTSSGSRAPNLSCGLAWMSRLLKDCEAEGEFEAKWPIIMLEGLARNALWYMCSELGVEKHGVPGQACRMLEKYLARYLRQHSYLINDAEAWILFKRALTYRFILLMVTCIRLATKMSSSSVQMNAAKIRIYLESKSLTYSQRVVCSTETEVYEMLLFTVPLWTSVEVGLMLGKTILKMSSSSLTGVGVLVNLCELYRNDIKEKLDWINATSAPASLRTLHLTVGAVLASNHFFGDDRRDHSVRLATYTCIHPNFLRSLVNIIIVLIETLKQDTEGSTQSKKRKLN